MRDKRIDQYIEKAAPFAQPILEHVRELVHSVCAEVEETIKWGFPHFDYKGQMMCSMAAFKGHMAISFWKAELLEDPDGILARGEAMGHLGRITSVKDLPSDRILKNFLKQAMKLNDAGVTVQRGQAKNGKPGAGKPGSSTGGAAPTLETPEDLAKALEKNKAAREKFDAFSPSHRKEYIQWITEAKTDATRTKRIETTIEWVAEGKGRNWKYQRKK